MQSSTMALMAAKGELPQPDVAIFADTAAEPPSVYKWLDWLERQLPFPVVRVMQGKGLTEAAQRVRTGKNGGKYVKPLIPAFSISPSGDLGIMPRKCTGDFKLAPLRREARRRMEEAGLKKVRQWIGISVDEAHRMRVSDRQYIDNWYPLIDKAMKRSDCLRWMEGQGYPRPPRSACIYCPFHSNQEWGRLAREEPDAFEAAVKMEKTLQRLMAEEDMSLCSEGLFLHPSRVPLEQATFTDRNQLDLWGNECEGMCGL